MCVCVWSVIRCMCCSLSFDSSEINVRLGLIREVMIYSQSPAGRLSPLAAAGLRHECRDGNKQLTGSYSHTNNPRTINLFTHGILRERRCHIASPVLVFAMQQSSKISFDQRKPDKQFAIGFDLQRPLPGSRPKGFVSR